MGEKSASVDLSAPEEGDNTSTSSSSGNTSTSSSSSSGNTSTSSSSSSGVIFVARKSRPSQKGHQQARNTSTGVSLDSSPLVILQRRPQDTEMNCSSPAIVLVEEPEEKFRFRYKSEMQGTHGCIHGKNSKKKEKKYPTVQAINVPADIKTVRFRVGLYTNQTPRRHHVHKVMWKQFSNVEVNFVEANASVEQGFKHSWKGLGIIHTSKKNIQDTIYNRLKKKLLEEEGVRFNTPNPVISDADDIRLKNEAHNLQKDIIDKMNTVVLGFEAFHVDNGIYRPLCPMAFSHPINNLKNPSTGDLKIIRTSSISASVLGGDEIFIFIERVKKGDIKVRFFEENNDDEERTWEAFAEFGENDVHHQYAIAFKTPPYKDVEVTEEVNVYFELYRPSDEAYSEKKAFRLTPSDDIRLRKKRRLTSQDDCKWTEREEYPAQHLPMDQGRAGMEEEGEEDSISMNFVENLLRDQEYCGTLGEPTPYDNITESAGQTVPDLHVLRREVTVNGDSRVHTSGGRIESDHAASNNGRDSGMATTSAIGREEQEAPQDLRRRFPQEATAHLNGGQRRNVFTGNGERRCQEEEARDRRSQEDTICQEVTREGRRQDETRVTRSQEDTRERRYEEEENLSGQVAETLSQALQLFSTTTDKNVVFRKIYNLLGDTNSEGNNTLHTAVISKQNTALKYLLEVSHKVNFTDLANEVNHNGHSPLHLAVITGEKEMASLLVRHHATTNIRDRNGNTPVHLAAKMGNTALMAAILGPLTDTNIANDRGLCPLHIAVQVNSLEMVSLLLSHGLDVNIRDRGSGKTALHFALERGLHLLVEFLVREGGADIDIVDYAGLSSRQLAEASGQMEILTDSAHHRSNKESYSRVPDYLKSDRSVGELSLGELTHLEAELRDDRWESLAEEMGLGHLVPQLGRSQYPPLSFIQYLTKNNSPVTSIANAFSKVIIKDENNGGE